MSRSKRSKKKDYEDDEDINIEEHSKKKSKENQSFKKRVIKSILKLLLIAILIGFVFLVISLVRFERMAKEMFNNMPSIVVDSDGNEIAKIGNERNRENISFDKIPDNLKNAYVSIEDQRYYSHIGIDVKRTGAAMLDYVKNFGKASFGGSTITQQLVKNLTGNTNNTVSRKMEEWSKSITLEIFFSKEEILEAYLNIIYVGPNVYGVQMGSKYYFNKTVEELDLAECAYLAGINHSPNSYNPFREEDKSEKIRIRTKTVLNKMLELEYINKSEYDEAVLEVEQGLKFERGDVNIQNTVIYSYHTDALISEIIKEIAENKKITETFAENYLYMANLKIHSTENSNIQKTIENEFNKKQYILNSEDGNKTSQAAMIIIDHNTGYVLGCVGGLGEKTVSRGFNRATQAKRQTGSAIKPIAILAPAIEEKVITAASIFNDTQTTFNDGSEEGYSPENYDNYLGEITVRSAVETSQNIPFVSMMELLTPKKSISYLNKMGISTLTKKDENLSLALGGLDKGMTPLETAAAYATIANDGVYIEPTFYTKIETSSGKNVLKSKQESKKVFSKQTAYIVKELLTQPVIGAYGTAKYCSISDMDVAAKTGTTNENYDRWLCGFTPYYTSAVWFGFDINETIFYNGNNPAGLIWSDVMKEIHKDLKGKTFVKPDKINMCTICGNTGKITNGNCKNTYIEYFLDGTEPETCNVH